MVTTYYNQNAVVNNGALQTTGGPLSVPKPVVKPAVAVAPKAKPITPAPTTTSKPIVGYNAAGKPVYGGAGTLYPNVSSTTLSNTNKIAEVPKITAKTDMLADKGVRTDPNTGVATFANGKIYEEPLKSTDTEKEDSEIMANLDRMQSELDASTSGLIASIKQKFDQRRSEQRDINAKANKGMQNSLLMGGVTGKGSSAQYAPISSEGIVTAQESYGLKQIAALDSQENDLIAAAQEAQRTGNFRILEAKNDEIDKLREKKIALATKLNEEIADRNNKAREANMQAGRDSTVADLYAQGITDVSTMLDYLNYDESGNQVGDFTADEIAKTLKNIVPPGLDDLVKTLRTNGAPQDVIQKVLGSKDINQAYESAGNYGAGGTGIIGEYNFYRAQAEQAGQVPVDFNTYQNQDANRKKSIAAAGVQYGGYDPQQTKAIDAINTSVSNNPAYKKFVSMKTFADNVESALAQGSGIGDIAAINQFQKVIDEGAVTRDQDVKLIQGAQSLSSQLQTKIKKLQKGDQLSSTQRQQIITLTQEMLKKQKESLAKDPSLLAQGKKADRFQIDPSETILGEIKANTMASDLIETEAQAEQKAIEVGKSNPEANQAIQRLIAKGTPYLEIVEALPEYFEE